MSATVRRLDWDSAFFGFPIAQLHFATLTERALDAALGSCREQHVRCAYLQLDAADTCASALAQARGFVVRDVRLEFERPTQDADSLPLQKERPVNPARGDERPRLEAIVAEAFVHSRFVADPGFPRARAAALYSAFLQRGLEDPHTRTTLVASDTSGFVVCHLDVERSVGTIELIAVGGDTRGGGVGRALMTAAMSTFAEAGLRRAEVATQAANIPAQRLYQCSGFRTQSARLWLHYWFDEPETSSRSSKY